MTAVLLAAPQRIHQSRRASEAPSVIVRDVSIIDVASGSITSHRDILIHGDRIADIRAAVARSVTGNGYVIPGLQDMHVHLWNDDPQLGLYIANGVTGVREMGGDLKRIRALQARIARGELTGPRILASGAAVSTAPADAGSCLSVRVVRTPDEARHIFDLFYDERVDFIRILDMDARSFEALAERSRHDGIPFAGFVPDSVPADVAAQDRMVTIEHLSGVGLACSSKQQELRMRLLEAKSNLDLPAVSNIETAVRNSYDPQVANSLYDLFRRYGVRQTPSLTRWSRMGCDRAHYEFAQKLTREMARRGVPILAGTDTGEPGTVPGLELHRELELLVAAGLSPAAALRSATLEPARLMRRDDLGEVKKGAVADLVVLRADPLEDIRNTRLINEVIVRGRPLDRAELDALLSGSR